MRLRLVEPDDCHAVVDLIDSVLKEYGDAICLEGADRDLNDVCGYYDKLGGSLYWMTVAESVERTRSCRLKIDRGFVTCGDFILMQVSVVASGELALWTGP